MSSIAAFSAFHRKGTTLAAPFTYKTGWVEKENNLNLYYFAHRWHSLPSHFHSLVSCNSVTLALSCINFLKLALSHYFIPRNCAGESMAWLVDWLLEILLLNGYRLA